MDRWRKKEGVGPPHDREMLERDREMKRGVKSDGRRRREGWRSGVKDRQGGKYRGQRQEEWMMNREHGEVIKSPVDSSVTACS